MQQSMLLNVILEHCGAMFILGQYSLTGEGLGTIWSIYFPESVSNMEFPALSQLFFAKIVDFLGYFI